MIKAASSGFVLWSGCAAAAGCHGAIQHNKAAAGKYFLNFQAGGSPSFCICTFRAAGAVPAPGAGPVTGGPPRQGYGCYAFARGQQIFRRDRHTRPRTVSSAMANGCAVKSAGSPHSRGKNAPSGSALRPARWCGSRLPARCTIFHYSGSHRIHHGSQGVSVSSQAAHQVSAPLPRVTAISTMASQPRRWRQYHSRRSAAAGRSTAAVFHTPREVAAARRASSVFAAAPGMQHPAASPLPQKVAKGFGAGIVLRG